MRKTKKTQKEEKTVISNLEYLKSLTHTQRLEVYKKMLGLKKTTINIQ